MASEAKQSPRFSKRLLHRCAPRNDSFSEHVFENPYKYRIGEFFMQNSFTHLTHSPEDFIRCQRIAFQFFPDGIGSCH